MPPPLLPGACYLNLNDPVLAGREGELKLPYLFRRNGTASPIDGVSAKDFELRCYLQLANVYVRSLGVAMKLNTNVSIINQTLRNLTAAVSDAQSIAPMIPE